jgi:2-methylcitrate dehydratase
VKENTTFTKEHYDPDKRYIGNAVQVFFKDGSSNERLAVDFPIGYHKCLAEGMPVLVKKFESSVAAHFGPKQAQLIQPIFADKRKILTMPVNEFVATMSK